jgi:hypothetical protein
MNGSLKSEKVALIALTAHVVRTDLEGVSMLESLSARRMAAMCLLAACLFSGCIFSSGEANDDEQADAADVTDTSDNGDASDAADAVDASDTAQDDARTDASDASDVTDATDAADTLDDATDVTDVEEPDGDIISDADCTPCTAPTNAEFAACEDGDCVFACKDDFADLNGDLNEENSDGCQGNCEQNEVRTFYLDGDGDSYGTPTNGRNFCQGDQESGYVANQGDCDDNDNRVNPEYSGGFQIVASDGGNGTFDYNCDGIVEKEDDDIGECGGLTCGLDPGWQDSVPDCGVEAEYVTDCVAICSESTEPRTQACR